MQTRRIVFTFGVAARHRRKSYASSAICGEKIITDVGEVQFDPHLLAFGRDRLTYEGGAYRQYRGLQ